MATQEMQISQTTTGSPVVRRTTVILAVAAALTVGAVIGRESATTSDAGNDGSARSADRTIRVGDGGRRRARGEVRSRDGSERPDHR